MNLLARLSPTVVLRGPFRWSEAWWPVVAALFSRVVLAGLVFFVRHDVPLRPGLATTRNPFPNNIVLESLLRWDAGSYVKIADVGYTGDGLEAFFPVYPLMMRTLGKVVGDTVTAGLLISNVAFVIDAILIYILARSALSILASQRAVALFVFHPATIVLSSVYTESLFILLATGSLLLARKQRILPAVVLAGIATATRMPGVALIPAIALYALRGSGFRLRFLRARHVLGLLATVLVPIGLLFFALHLKRKVGDPLAFLHAGALWKRSLAPPWAAFRNFFAYNGPIIGFNWCELVTVSMAIVAAALGFFVLELPLAVFTVVSLMLPLSSSIISSTQRYTATAVPLYLVLAIASHRAMPRLMILSVWFAASAFTATMFVLGYWAG